MVSKDIPDNVVVVGNPNKIICTYDEYMEKNKRKLDEFHPSKKYFYEKTEDDWNELYHKVKENNGGFDL